ncbi:MAG: GNAT family N-acetyltransferase [Smithella sp.]
MKHIFRKAKEQDINALSGLLMALFSIETDFAVDPQKQKAGLALFFNSGEEKAIFVAENKGVLVGMVTCQMVISTATGGYSILIEDLYVLERFRHRGIGTALIQMAQKWGDGKGALRIQLLADKRNKAAHIFYRMLGFQASRMNGLYMPLGG